MSTAAVGVSSEDDDFVIKPPFIHGKSIKKYEKHGRAILKANENIFKAKSKCTRALKNKLKKYKLRKDGEEDPDVLNVSQCLSLALKIRSPVAVNNNNNECNNVGNDQWTIPNYLAKVAKKSTQIMKVCVDNRSIKDLETETLQKTYDTSENMCSKTMKTQEKKDTFNSTESSEDENFICSESHKKIKEMNAFQLMMNARNKSIGSNSPGKDKNIELSEDENSKRQLKLKRSLALENMAQAKGSLKNKEMEALKDESIQLQMDKRAKRLKNMLNKNSKSSSKSGKSESLNSRNLQKNEIGTTINKKHIKRRRKSDVSSETNTKRLKTDVLNVHNDTEGVIEVDENDEDCVEGKNCEVSSNKSEIANTGNIVATEISPVLCKRITESDGEFLSKLSPSIRKKESMLSYFGKIEKKIDSEENNEDEVSLENIIKVKITPKRNYKNKTHKNKNKYSIQEGIPEKNIVTVKMQSFKSKEIPIKRNKKKSKKIIYPKLQRTQILEVHGNDNELASEEMKTIKTINNKSSELSQRLSRSPSPERRSKRATKRPVKYEDCMELSSEDSSNDELKIKLLTSKSSKNTTPTTMKLRKKDTSKTVLNDCTLNKGDGVSKTTKSGKLPNKNDLLKQSTKLAPIFTHKNQLSSVDLEAKQKFLQSGIPNKLRKIIDQQKSLDFEENYFSIVHHVQQMTLSKEDFNPWLLQPVHFELNSEEDDNQLNHNNLVYKDLKFETMPYREKRSVKVLDVNEKLDLLKREYPKFPIYRTFRILKSKCSPDKGDIDQCSDIEALTKSSNDYQESCETKVEDLSTKIWAEKFRPNCASDIIGNFEGVNTLKKWLSTWKENNFDGKSQRLQQRANSSDSSDFYYPSDTDSRDSVKSYNNVLVITGPVGCGKTSAIYAVAAELAMKVIEVNASAKRTGKTILSNLQEATQSHKVNRGATSSESQNSQELFGSQNINKRSKSKPLKTYSKKCLNTDLIVDRDNGGLNGTHCTKTESNRTAMSIILVEDADLVFEQDDGFVSALNQIVQISKRPVIIVTSSLTCLHLQRFITNGNVIKFHNLSPKMLGTWLDILCLVEKAEIWPNIGQMLLDFCKGDMRKAINTLQFWTANEHVNSVFENCHNEEALPGKCNELLNIEDESSTMSWADHEKQQDKHNDPNKCFENEVAILTKSLFNTFISFCDHDIGINSYILQFPVDNLNLWWNIPSLFALAKEKTDIVTENIGNKNAKQNTDELNALTALIDSISVSDLMFSKIKPTVKVTVLSDPWKTDISDSVSEAVDTSTYNSGGCLGDSISYALLTSSLSASQKAFGSFKEHCDYTLPGMAQIRSRERIITRHRGLYDGLSLSSQLDRRGLAMDYLSTCREICRIEKDKSDHNSKRNNRFCHYLKSLKVTSSSETLETLCESLSPHSVNNDQ